MATQYVSSVAYTAVAQWAASTVYAAGAIVRQSGTVTQGNERCFRTAAGGTSGSTQPTWVLTEGAASPTDGTVTDWTEVTGQQAYQTSGGAWNAPHARLTNAIASGWAAAGDAIYVRSDHNESFSGSLTIAFPGTLAAPNICQCVQVNCAIPPGGSDATTGAQITGSVGGSIGGSVYWSGINVNCTGTFTGFGFTGTNQKSAQNINNATFGAPNINFLGSGTVGRMARLRFNNVFFQQNANPNSGGFFGLSNAADTLVEWVGGGFTGTARTSPIFGENSADEGLGAFYLRNIDFSFFGAGYTFISPAANSSIKRFTMEKCKFSTDITLLGSAPTVIGSQYDFLGCDLPAGAGNSLYNARYDYSGTLTTDTTVVEASGASAASTPFSWKIVTNASNSYAFPFETFPMQEFYVGTTGSPISQYFDLMTDNVVLTNKDAWIELEYYGTSGSTQGSFVSTGVANILTAGTNLTTGSQNTWTTTGITTPKPQQIKATWTPQVVGWYRPVLKIAKASTTIWAAPPSAKAA